MKSIFNSLIKEKESKKLNLKSAVKFYSTNFRGDDYCDLMYDKFNHLLPMNESKVASIFYESPEKLHDILHASVTWFQKEQKFVSVSSVVDTRDLFNFLNYSDSVFNLDTKELTLNSNGLNFLNYFILKEMLDAPILGKRKTSVSMMIKDKKKVYNSICRTLLFNPKLHLRQIFNAMRMTNGVQTPSNFRPLSAYYLYSLGLESMRARKDNTLYIKVPSEGWLGRLLSAYKIAYENPEITIVYDSIDPNVAVCRKFDEVLNYLLDLRGVRKVDNLKARIHCTGSETTIFSNVYGYKYDVIGTSPPYYDKELYTEGFEVEIMNISSGELSSKKMSSIDQLTLKDGTKILVKEVLIGQIINLEGIDYQVISKTNTGQSRNKSTKARAWNETFLRPTFENNFKDLHDTGILWWNISDVSNHPTFCKDSERIALETGFELVDVFKYSLNRVPGGILVNQEDGTKKRVDLREIKESFEPVYIYKKP